MSFSCDGCQSALVDPCALPCGELFCGACIEEMSVCDGESLPVVQEEEGGLPLEKALAFCKSCRLGFRDNPSTCIPLKDLIVKLQSSPTPQEDDVQCSICLEMLWMPSILPCGHWLCFWCNEKIPKGHLYSQCPLCRAQYQCKPRPCVALQSFLLLHFPNLKEEREGDFRDLESITMEKLTDRKTVQMVVGQLANAFLLNMQTGTTESPQFIWPHNGCDGCGVFPIRGQSLFQCLDCLEYVGFDLCTECHLHHQEDSSGVAGRYGQFHDPSCHEIVEITAQMLKEYLITLYQSSLNQGDEDEDEDEEDEEENGGDEDRVSQ